MVPSTLLDDIDLVALAEVIEEGLTAAGVVDDTVEVLGCYYEEGCFQGGSHEEGQKRVYEAVVHYNNAIEFRNRMLPNEEPMEFLNHEEAKDWFE